MSKSRILVIATTVTIFACVVALLGAIYNYGQACDRARLARQQITYRAWGKVHPDQNLWFDEWSALQQAGLLPK